MQRFVSHSVQDTEKIAAKLAEKLKGGEVIAFTGPMGMGKTAFISADLCWRLAAGTWSPVRRLRL